MKTVTLLVAILATSIVNSLPVNPTPLSGEQPHRVRVLPSNPNPGDTVTVEVELAGIVDADQPVAITGTPGFWSVLPSTVTVLEGNKIVTFQATVNPNTQSGGSVTASCNGGSSGVYIAL